MIPINYQSYREIFSSKMKKCKSKKDYKRLCKEMIYQFDVIDKIDENQCRILSTMIGSDNYTKALAMAIKMYLLEQQGQEVDVVSFEQFFDRM